MRSRLADYRLLHPLETHAAAPSWVAEAPERLGRIGTVVVTELAGVDESDWAGAVERMAELAAVSSPHLLPLLEAGRTDEPDGVVSWVSRERGRATAVPTGTDRSTALRAVAGAALGAQALHDAGVVHGAITSSTILLDADRGVLDLPPSRAALSPPAVTRAGVPELLDATEPDAIWGAGPTPTSDIYSLGAAAHGLLTGRLLHPSLATDQPVTAVQRALIEPPSVDPSLGEDVANLVRACLAVDPADRPATAGAFAELLFDLAGGAAA